MNAAHLILSTQLNSIAVGASVLCWGLTASSQGCPLSGQRSRCFAFEVVTVCLLPVWCVRIELSTNSGDRPLCERL